MIKLKRKEIAQLRAISYAYSAGRRAAVEAKAKEMFAISSIQLTYVVCKCPHTNLWNFFACKS